MARGANSAPAALADPAGFCTASALPMRAAAALRKLCNQGD